MFVARFSPPFTLWVSQNAAKINSTLFMIPVLKTTGDVSPETRDQVSNNCTFSWAQNPSLQRSEGFFPVNSNYSNRNLMYSCVIRWSTWGCCPCPLPPHWCLSFEQSSSDVLTLRDWYDSWCLLPVERFLPSVSADFFAACFMKSLETIWSAFIKQNTTGTSATEVHLTRWDEHFHGAETIWPQAVLPPIPPIAHSAAQMLYTERHL